jgi:clan AA aspartic protease (TIGR02281 family)
MARAHLDRNATAIALNAILKGPTGIEKGIRVLLDTGASCMIIPWKIAEALGYRPEAARRRVEIITVSGVEQAPLITLDTVSVLGEQARNVEVVVHDLPPRSFVDGLLGLSFLKHFRLTISLQEEFIELVTPE